MKTNKMMRIASCLLVAVLLSTCAISGTFAKYTSTAEGSDTATVAKWSFTVNSGEIAVASPSVTFGLFDTINDTGDSADETDVSDDKIAPGTAGHFDLKVKNNAEVKAKYTISFTETNASNVPLQYSLDNTTWVDSIAELTTTGLTDQELGIGAAEVTKTIYWRWAFDGTGAHAGQTDATDTALGYAQTAPTVTIKATITATQVD